MVTEVALPNIRVVYDDVDDGVGIKGLHPLTEPNPPMTRRPSAPRAQQARLRGIIHTGLFGSTPGHTQTATWTFNYWPNPEHLVANLP